MKYVKFGFGALAAQTINANCYKCTKVPTIHEVCKLLKIDKQNVFYNEEIKFSETLNKLASKKSDSHNNSANTYYVAAQRGFAFKGTTPKCLMIGFTQQLKIDGSLLEKIEGANDSDTNAQLEKKVKDNMDAIIIHLFHAEFVENNCEEDNNNEKRKEIIYVSKK